ncbi:hypothetical protein CHBNIII7_15570 [Haemophilus influenzae]|nr:hypothetical protein CHBNIII7_15570 [Haemophilus influenzae]
MSLSFCDSLIKVLEIITKKRQFVGDELFKIGVPLIRVNGDLSISQTVHHWAFTKILVKGGFTVLRL